MKIMMKDNWVGKQLNYPTNICTFAWGVAWRLVCAVALAAAVMGFVWLWCMAFYDGFISGHKNAAVAGTVWVALTALATAVVLATKDSWYNNLYVKRLRAAVVEVCPVIEWDRGNDEDKEV